MRCVTLLTAVLCAGCYYHAYWEEEPAPPPGPDYGDPLTRAEVEKLVRAGISDAVVIEKAKKSGAAPLSSDDIVALKQAGASDALVKELIANARAPRAKGAYPARTVYYEHYDWWYPAPSVIWLGATWSHHHYGHRHYYGSRGRSRVCW